MYTATSDDSVRKPVPKGKKAAAKVAKVMVTRTKRGG